VGKLGAASCAIALILLYTQRRDRRLVARAPLAGAVLACAALVSYAAWRYFLRPGPVGRADGHVVRFILGACSGFAVPLALAWGRALVLQDVPALARAVRGAKGWTAISVLMGCLFAAVYFFYGQQLGRLGVFDRIDMLFDADPKFHQSGWGTEIHTSLHPLLPAGWYLSCTLASRAVAAEWAPLAVSAGFGGLCVTLAALYFKKVTGSRLLGLAGAFLLGCTTAHLSFAAMPESYIVAAATLISLQLLVAHRQSLRLRFRHAVLVGVLATGVTITNAAAALVCYCCWRRTRRAAYVVRWAAYSLLIGSALLAAQSLILPQACGLEPSEYVYQQRFLHTQTPLGQRLAGLVNASLVQNVVGWIPAPAVIYGRPALRAGLQYDRLGQATVWLWAVSSVAAAWMVWRRRTWGSATFVAALLCLLVAAGFHSQYGYDNLFLYSCCFTFYVLALPAHGLAGSRSAPVALIVVVICVAMAVNNARFCKRVPAMLGELERARGWVSPEVTDPGKAVHPES